MPTARSSLFETTVLVLGADREFAAATCVHLSRLGASLLLAGTHEERLVHVDNTLIQPELHRYIASDDPERITAWALNSAAKPSRIVSFEISTRPVPTLPASRTLHVRAFRPGGAHDVEIHASTPGLQRPGGWSNTLSAYNVASLELLAELEARATALGTTTQALLAEHYGGAVPEPLLTSERLAQIVETLLGPFTDFALGEHYVVDGLRRDLPSSLGNNR
jgi:hypothetical protein